MITIYSNFNKLKEEKKKQILSAAIKEFRQYGFDKASTIEIAKKGKISKGALFNYFGTKKDLYSYLLDHSLGVIKAFYEEIDLREKDLFKRIENIGLQKLYTQQKFPQVFDFLTSTREEGSPEVKDIITEKTDDIYKQGIAKIYADIDYSKFREDIDIQKAMEVLNWTMLGFSEKSIKQLGTFADLDKFGDIFLKEWDEYAMLLKKCYYKNA